MSDLFYEVKNNSLQTSILQLTHNSLNIVLQKTSNLFIFDTNNNCTFAAYSLKNY